MRDFGTWLKQIIFKGLILFLHDKYSLNQRLEQKQDFS